MPYWFKSETVYWSKSTGEQARKEEEMKSWGKLPQELSPGGTMRALPTLTDAETLHNTNASITDILR